MIVGSPGFVKESFFQYMQQQADQKNIGFIKNILEKTILAHTSSGYKHSLNEILQNKTVQDKIKDLSVFQESVSLDKFFEILSLNPDKVCYGYKSVEFALKS